MLKSTGECKVNDTECNVSQVCESDTSLFLYAHIYAHICIINYSQNIDSASQEFKKQRSAQKEAFFQA